MLNKMFPCQNSSNTFSYFGNKNMKIVKSRLTLNNLTQEKITQLLFTVKFECM